MFARPYHHGGLRAALLTRAEDTLRRSGVDGLSLRELARAEGVSHGAPQRHFRDKAALLDALAVEGFQRLGSAITEATRPDGGDFSSRLTSAAVAYVRFATDNAALADLMFTSKHGADASEELRHAADESFTQMAALVQVGQATGELVEGDQERIGMVFFATVQGITSLANTQMVERADLTDLTSYAVASILHGLAPREPARTTSG
ncbi:MAG TPA: TetR/AcrR family transcriptional regulator [Propionibacteriaceae bacterium]